MKGYLVRTDIPEQSNYSNQVFTDCNDARAYFFDEVARVIYGYMEEDDTLEQWLDKDNGIIVTEYGGNVSENRVDFDFNVVELVEVEINVKNTSSYIADKYTELAKKVEKIADLLYINFTYPRDIFTIDNDDKTVVMHIGRISYGGEQLSDKIEEFPIRFLEYSDEELSAKCKEYLEAKRNKH